MALSGPVPALIDGDLLVDASGALSTKTASLHHLELEGLATPVSRVLRVAILCARV